ncbi:MAG: AMP-binding protein, partial [Elusimicrobiota bacterium]
MTLHEIVNELVTEHASRTAFIYRDEKITYKDFDARARRMASALYAHGVKAGDRWALCVRNSPEFVVTWFALSRLGAIAVHMNFMVAKEEAAFILKDSGAKGVVSQKEFATKIREAAKAAGTKTILWTDLNAEGPTEMRFSDFYAKGAADVPIHKATKDTPAAILYTSGTTGNPKGAVLTHGNFASNAKDSVEFIGLKPGKETVLCILPMFHIFAWTALVLGSLYMRAPLVIVESITPPKPWLKLMSKWKVTIFAAVPPIYHVLSKEAKGFKGLVLRYFFFRSVRIAISGAAPLPVSVLETFERKFGVPILEGYGMTETSPTISVNTADARRPGTVGKAIPRVSIKILDDEGKELATGQEGEVCAKGPNVMAGYFNLPQETQEIMTKDGYLRTGDIGRFDTDGFLTICDRKKDMIIVKGLKVFPVQIEDIILKHPKVQE